jgi:hypothetical protein
MEEYKVKKKELKQDFFILILCLILVITSLTNVIVCVINEDTKELKIKLEKIEKKLLNKKLNKANKNKLFL